MSVGLDPVDQALGSDPGARQRAMALAQILRLTAGAVGLGAAVRGAQGLTALMHGPSQEKVQPAPVSIPITLPPRHKRAAFDPKAWPLTSLAGHALDFFGKLRDAQMGPAAKWWMGWNPRGWDDIPLATPAAIGLGTAGLAAGYGATGALAHAVQNKSEEEELAKARAEYEHALAAQTKRASADPLDALYDRLEKQAWPEFLDNLATNVWKNYKNYALAAGLLTAIPSGMIAYDITRKQSPEKILEEAMQRRQRQLQLLNPAPVMAVLPARRAKAATDTTVESDSADSPGRAAQLALHQLERRRQQLQAATQAQLGGNGKQPAAPVVVTGMPTPGA